MRMAQVMNRVNSHLYYRHPHNKGSGLSSSRPSNPHNAAIYIWINELREISYFSIIFLSTTNCSCRKQHSCQHSKELWRADLDIDGLLSQVWRACDSSMYLLHMGLCSLNSCVRVLGCSGRRLLCRIREIIRVE